MKVDIGNALDSVASPGVPRDALERLDSRVARAHERIRAGIDAEAHGYAALRLHETVDLEAIAAAADRFDDVETILVVGIGGSALGAATVVSALSPGDRTVAVLDNVDPDATRGLLASIDLDRTLLHVVSRSGTTVETLANFLVVRRAMVDAGVDWSEQTLVTTGPDGPLRRLATRHDLPVLDVPDGVPGRYSVLSSVGLPVAELCGIDCEAIIDGAKARSDALTGSLFESPPYAYGAIAFALSQRGYDVNVMMPYAEALETFAEWFAQLWAESLGKDGLGQVPVRALGVTDQHSQLQLYRAGPRNSMLTFLRPRNRGSVGLPDVDIEPLSFLSGLDLASLVDAEFEATEASLAAAGRPSVRVEIDRVDARSMGGLFFDFEAACIMMAELLAVDAFDQPAVEWAKRATRGILGESATDHDIDTGEKNRLVIG